MLNTGGRNARRLLGSDVVAHASPGHALYSGDGKSWQSAGVETVIRPEDFDIKFRADHDDGPGWNALGAQAMTEGAPVIHLPRDKAVSYCATPIVWDARASPLTPNGTSLTLRGANGINAGQACRLRYVGAAGGVLFMPIAAVGWELSNVIFDGGGLAKHGMQLGQYCQNVTSVRCAFVNVADVAGYASCANGDASGLQASENRWLFCNFNVGGGAQYASGWRNNLGGNIKNSALWGCHFVACGIGLDVNRGSGTYSIDHCIAANNEIDIFLGGGANVTVTGFQSEGSHMLMLGGAPDMTVALKESYFSGACTHDVGPFISAPWPWIDMGILLQGRLHIDGGGFANPRTADSEFGIYTSNDNPAFASWLRSSRATYYNSRRLPAVMLAGGPTFALDSDLSIQQLKQRFESEGDYGAAADGGWRVPFPRIVGGPTIDRSQAIFAQHTSPGLLVVPGDGWTKYVLTYDQLTADAVSQTWLVAFLRPKQRLKQVMAEVKTAFAGIAGLAATVDSYTVAGGDVAGGLVAQFLLGAVGWWPKTTADEGPTWGTAPGHVWVPNWGPDDNTAGGYQGAVKLTLTAAGHLGTGIATHATAGELVLTLFHDTGPGA